MQNNITRLGMLLLILFTFTGCEAIGDIFQAGMGFGIFIVIIIIAVIVLIIGQLGGNK
jgi:hypothetical protein